MLELLPTRHFLLLFITLVVIFFVRELAVYREIKIGKYLLTPLITACIVGFVIIAFHKNGIHLYGSLIFTSLLLALIADTLLMIDEVNLMQYGIVFFALGHIIYALAFSLSYTFQLWHLFPAIVLIVFAVLLIILFKGKTKGLDIPVFIYIGIICIMAYFAYTGFGKISSPKTIFRIVGATIFVLSDLVLSINAFLKPITKSSVYTWALYAPAQFLIAMSCF